MTKRYIPDVVRGGTAIPLKDKTNYYYMRGRKHKNGGIDIGKNPRTGIEVEDGEIMHVTKNETKVFSAQPFLNGESPANKVMKGENPNKVFKEQEQYKDRKGLNDDGTKKAKNGGVYSITVNGKTRLRMIPSTGEFTLKSNDKRSKANLGEFIKNNPELIEDGISLASNLTGSILSYYSNKNMLKNLKYSNAPVARKAAKLKTNININPQLDKMRESVAAYERDIDANTASSRVALARKQRGRFANMLQTNELYGNKENLETELINKDRLNQQAVADKNITEYNNWSERKAAFDNTVREKRAENNISLIQNINSGIQDVISRTEKRKSDKQNRIAISAANPNVNPRILRDLGVTTITDKEIENWEKVNGKTRIKQ